MKNMRTKIYIFFSILVVVFAFNNCQGFRAHHSLWGFSPSLPSAIRVIFDGAALVCDDLAGGSPAEVGRRLQSCFDRADAYGVVELLPGVHLVSQATAVRFKL